MLTRAFDRMSRSPRFSPDGKFVYFIADDDGTQNLFRVPADRRGNHASDLGARCGLRLHHRQVGRPGRADREHGPARRNLHH